MDIAQCNHQGSQSWSFLSVEMCPTRDAIMSLSYLAKYDATNFRQSNDRDGRKDPFVVLHFSCFRIRMQGG